MQSKPKIIFCLLLKWDNNYHGMRVGYIKRPVQFIKHAQNQVIKRMPEKYLNTMVSPVHITWRLYGIGLRREGFILLH